MPPPDNRMIPHALRRGGVLPRPPVPHPHLPCRGAASSTPRIRRTSNPVIARGAATWQSVIPLHRIRRGGVLPRPPDNRRTPNSCVGADASVLPPPVQFSPYPWLRIKFTLSLQFSFTFTQVSMYTFVPMNFSMSRRARELMRLIISPPLPMMMPLWLAFSQ